LVLYASYTIYDLKNPYTVNIPFICERCGYCCREWPRLSIIPSEITEFLGYDITDEARKQCVEDYLLNEYGRIKQPCGFFRDGGCIIYPVRPDVCRGFPITSGRRPLDETWNDLCLGYIRLNQLEDRLVRKPYISWEGSGHDSEKEGILIKEPPTKAQQRRILKKFMSLDPDEEELRLFKYVNNIE
jgi:Fe-S-cluster containining protein